MARVDCESAEVLLLLVVVVLLLLLSRVGTGSQCAGMRDEEQQRRAAQVRSSSTGVQRTV